MGFVSYRDDIILCPDCDLLLERVSVEPGSSLVCPRCAAVLESPVKNTVEKTLALTLTGLLMFIPAVFLPIFTLNAAGLVSKGSVFGSSIALLRFGYIFTGIAVLATGVLVPLIKLILLLMISLPLYLGRCTRATARYFRMYKRLDEWGMVEVYMLGILVTIIKLGHMARIHYDTGFFCFIGLLLATLLSSIFLDEHSFWKEISQQTSEKRTSSRIQDPSLHGKSES